MSISRLIRKHGIYEKGKRHVTTWLLRAGIIGLAAYMAFYTLNYVIDWMSHHKVMIVLTVFVLSWLLIPLFIFLEAKHSKVPWKSTSDSEQRDWEARRKQQKMKRIKKRKKELERKKQEEEEGIYWIP